jgi:hypothetical protein
VACAEEGRLERREIMSSAMGAAEEWLNENHEDLILCPHQPGGLMISRTACMKRHEAAAKEKEPTLIDEKDIFSHRWKKGLLLCRECRIGNALSRSLAKESPHSEEASLG